MKVGTSQRVVAATILSLVAGAGFAIQAAAQDAAPTTEAAANHGPQAAPHPAGGSGIDARVQLLAKELDLDAGQQVEVRKILVRQRADVIQVWNNESMPAQVQVASTRAIGERTADSIRAILNDKQRARYSKALPAPASGQATPGGDSWTNVLGSN